MKKLFKTLTVTFLASLILTGCKKDDEKSNFFRVDDSRFQLGSGCLINHGYSGATEGFLYYMYLASPEITINQYGEPTSGSGQVFRVRLVSSSLIGLETGDYVYDETSVPLPFLSFNNAGHSTNWTFGGLISYTDIVSGVIKVTNNNDDIYEISIDCEDENGDQVTGYYKGLLIYAYADK